MRLFTKFIKVPWSNAQRDQLTVQTWAVRWQSWQSSWMGSRIASPFPQVEVFFTEGDAQEFAKSLKNAQKLLKNTGNLDIRVEKLT